jgi:hypothetical protein
MGKADYGFVYLLGNVCMPNIYKVGFTDRAPHQRAKELSASTSVPKEFDVLCYIEVSDPQYVEGVFHSWLKDRRVSPGREFFDVDDLIWLAGIYKHYRDALSFSHSKLIEYMSTDDCEFDGDIESIPCPFQSSKSKEAPAVNSNECAQAAEQIARIASSVRGGFDA